MSPPPRAVEYTHEGKAFEGLLVLDSAPSGKRPAVLVFHDWAGRTAPHIDIARKLAGWGYAGFACDLYGQGVTGTTKEECEALMVPLASDRQRLRGRILKSLEVARSQPEVDASRVAAIGFCFGGLCVLDLARTGTDVRGVASFHGLLQPPPGHTEVRIPAKVAVFHGWADPMVKPESVVALGEELTRCQADWQVHAYGGAMHAFMMPQANDPAAGIQYHAAVARRSWDSLQSFLAECLA